MHDIKLQIYIISYNHAILYVPKLAGWLFGYSFMIINNVGWIGLKDMSFTVHLKNENSVIANSPPMQI